MDFGLAVFQSLQYYSRLDISTRSRASPRSVGAPRSMTMGTIASPCRYDAAARHASQSANLRRPAILHYASWAAVFPGWSAYPLIAALRSLLGIDAMCHKRTHA